MGATSPTVLLIFKLFFDSSYIQTSKTNIKWRGCKFSDLLVVFDVNKWILQGLFYFIVGTVTQDVEYGRMSFSKVTDLEGKELKVKNFHCNVCQKIFLKKSDLVRHIRSHTGEKPFSCEVCGKCFSLKGNLRAHSIVHM